MSQHVRVSELAGKEDNVTTVLALLIDIFDFLQMFVNIVLKRASKVLVFQGFVDGIHGLSGADNTDIYHI